MISVFNLYINVHRFTGYTEVRAHPYKRYTVTLTREDIRFSKDPTPYKVSRFVLREWNELRRVYLVSDNVTLEFIYAPSRDRWDIH